MLIDTNVTSKYSGLETEGVKITKGARGLHAPIQTAGQGWQSERTVRSERSERSVGRSLRAVRSFCYRRPKLIVCILYGTSGASDL